MALAGARGPLLLARPTVEVALAVAALLAMLTPTLGQLADGALAGRSPLHGHVGLASPGHSHPYDHAPTGSAGDASSESNTAFALSDDGGVAASVLVSTPEDGSAWRRLGSTWRLPAVERAAPASAAVAVLVPPPQVPVAAR